MRRLVIIATLLGALLVTTGCEQRDTGGGQATDGSPLREVARFPDRQVTGVAVSSGGRIFVSFPRWSDDHDLSVAELGADGGLTPYPDATWNNWQGGSETAGQRFVCVQSVYVDAENDLWILDPASPRIAGVVSGGPKLVHVDLADDTVERVYHLGKRLAPEGSYLNDVRVDTGLRTAYITDSGVGALVVLNLESGEGHRLLDDHPSTEAEPGYMLEIDGEEVRAANGQVPVVHSDGIALSPDRRYLYFHALTGRTLYRVETDALRDESLSADRLGGLVENLGETVAVDGMLMDATGTLYLSALEENAIMRWTPDGGLETVVRDPGIQWPDTFALGPKGALYFTTSQIHVSPLLGLGDERTEAYGLWKIPAASR